MNSWLFPPQTREVQFDEKWNFIGKKEKNTDPDDPRDDERGDDWDHTAIDPEHRLLLAVVPGERSAENCKKVVQEVYDRTAGKGAMLQLLHAVVLLVAHRGLAETKTDLLQLDKVLAQLGRGAARRGSWIVQLVHQSRRQSTQRHQLLAMQGKGLVILQTVLHVDEDRAADHWTARHQAPETLFSDVDQGRIGDDLGRCDLGLVAAQQRNLAVTIAADAPEDIVT